MLEKVQIQCPYCGEIIETSVDTSEGSYSTVEDCQVCCRPMSLEVICSNGKVEQVLVSVA